MELMEQNESNFYYTNEWIDAKRQNRIKELTVLKDKYLGELEYITEQASALELEIQILNDRLKAYRTIEDGYWNLYHHVDGQLRMLDPDYKAIAEQTEQLKREIYQAGTKRVGHQEH